MDKHEIQGLQANLTPEQRAYFDILKSELIELFDGRDYESIKKSGDVESLKKISAKLAQFEDFFKTKDIPVPETLKQYIDLWRQARSKFKFTDDVFGADCDYELEKSEMDMATPLGIVEPNLLSLKNTKGTGDRHDPFELKQGRFYSVYMQAYALWWLFGKLLPEDPLPPSVFVRAGAFTFQLHKQGLFAHGGEFLKLDGRLLGT